MHSFKFKNLKKLLNGGIFILLFLFLSSSGLPSFAQTKQPFQGFPFDSDPPQSQPVSPNSTVPAAPSAPGLDDPRELEAFMDGFFAQELDAKRAETPIPGGAVSIVKDGKLFFAKGYGYANVEEKVPVEADKTLFRVASLSKLLTATAAMQLYERGQLDLAGAVNQYLTTFQLENPFAEPVRVAQLMTHTDGTTKRRIGIAARTAEGIQSLGDYLADHMPPVVWRPGTLYSYSSHSITLLGYLIQQISGLPFTQYIDQNILQPLGMRRSTFLQPPPAELANNLAIGYQYRSGQFRPVPYLYLNIAPAASLQATATDMANFMLAHLVDRQEEIGQNPNVRVLQPETVRLMHEQHFTHHPQLPGTGYSFRERLENSIRLVGHVGSLRGYSSSLTLMPDRNIGIFIATNSFSGIHEKLLSQFLDRYFPAPKTIEAPQPLQLTDQQLDRFTGIYRDLEYPRDTFAKISAPYQRLQITKGDNGTLLVRSPNLFFLGGSPQAQLVPIAPLLFQQVNTDRLTAFGEDEQGRIAFVFNPVWAKIGAFERIPWYEGAWVQLGFIGLCAIIFFSAALIYPIQPLIRFLRGDRFELGRRYERESYRAWIAAGWTGTLNLVFLIGLPLSLWLIGVWKLVYGVPLIVVVLLCIPILTTVLALALLVFALLSWRDKNWSWAGRIHYSLIAIAALTFIPVLSYWNLLGFEF